MLVGSKKRNKKKILANMTTQFIPNPWRHQQFRVVSPPTDVQQSPQRMPTVDFASTKSSHCTPWHNMIDKCLFLRAREAVMAHVRHGSHLRKKKKFDCESVDTCSSNANMCRTLRERSFSDGNAVHVDDRRHRTPTANPKSTEPHQARNSGTSNLLCSTQQRSR